MTRHVSADGLCSSSDKRIVRLWDRIGMEQHEMDAEATALLRSMGVKAAHPDDGWVNRSEDWVSFAYPQFNDGPDVDDLIALGWPWSGYRLVRVTEVRHWGVISDTIRYHFEKATMQPESGPPLQIVYARPITAYQVTCPDCRHVTTWADGAGVGLDGCTIQCEQCRTHLVVRTR